MHQQCTVVMHLARLSRDANIGAKATSHEEKEEAEKDPDLIGVRETFMF